MAAGAGWGVGDGRGGRLRDDDYTSYRFATVSADGAVTAVPIPSMDALALFPTDDGKVHPGRDGVGALLLGECDAPAPRTQYLWVVTG